MSGIPFVGGLLDTLRGMIRIGDWIDLAYNIISDLSWGVQLAGALILALVVIMGVFALIKKLSKLIIVVAILFGLYLLYDRGVFTG